MNEWKPDVCCYHANCDDGFGAAWAVWKLWNDDVTYMPCSYGAPLPCFADKHILFVDFSLKRKAMEELFREENPPKSIVVLDHHKTAEAELEPFTIHRCNGSPAHLFGQLHDLPGMLRDLDELCRPPIVAFFDMEKSGARMAWEFCHPLHPSDMPYIISLIEDRDLWRFKHGDDTKRFSAALRTYPHDFYVWNDISTRVGEMLVEGTAILRGHQKIVEELCQHAYLDKIGEHTVPMVNVPPHYSSDCAHMLLKRNADAPFAATWSRGGNGTITYQLRSEDHRADVSEIAKLFGGGGHRNAAGYKVAA